MSALPPKADISPWPVPPPPKFGRLARRNEVSQNFYEVQKWSRPIFAKSQRGRVLSRRLSYPSRSMARYEIPKKLPELVGSGDAFVPSDEATVEEWQRHKIRTSRSIRF